MHLVVYSEWHAEEVSVPVIHRFVGFMTPFIRVSRDMASSPKFPHSVRDFHAPVYLRRGDGAAHPSKRLHVTVEIVAKEL